MILVQAMLPYLKFLQMIQCNIPNMNCNEDFRAIKELQKNETNTRQESSQPLAIQVFVHMHNGYSGFCELLPQTVVPEKHEP
jgi:hypothetical protein